MWKKATFISTLILGSLFVIFTMALPTVTYIKSSVKQNTTHNVNSDVSNIEHTDNIAEVTTENNNLNNLPSDTQTPDIIPTEQIILASNSLDHSALDSSRTSISLDDVIPEELTPAEYSTLKPLERIEIINQKMKKLSENRDNIVNDISMAESENNSELLELLNKEKLLTSTLEYFYLQEIDGIRQELSLLTAKDRLLSHKNDENLTYIINSSDYNFSVVMLLRNEIDKENDNIQLSKISIEKLNKVNLALSDEVDESSKIQKEISCQNLNINNQLILNVKLSMEVSQIRVKLLEEELKKRIPKSSLSGNDLTFMEDLINRNNAELVEQVAVYEKNLAFCEEKLHELSVNQGNLFGRNVTAEHTATYKVCLQINQEALNLVEEFIFLNKFNKDLHSHNLRIAAKIVYHDELTAIKAELERTLPYLSDLANEKRAQLAIWKKSIKSAELKSFIAKDKQLAATLNEQIKFYNNGIASYEKYLTLNAEVITFAIQVLNEINQKLGSNR